MTDLPVLINRLSERHLLKNCPQIYRDGFLAAISNVYGDSISDQILQHKFLIPDDSKFTVDAYCQHASELSVANHIVLQAVRGFQAEKHANLSNDSNVDVYYETGRTRVFLEVKCPSERVDPKGTLVFKTAGRIRDHDEVFNDLKKLIETADPSQNLIFSKNKDHTLKDFLLSSHKKFSPDSGLDDVNILFIACGYYFEISEWFGFLYGRDGLFTGDPFHPSADYRLVDVVILSNLQYLHSKAQAHHDWTLKDAFILPFVNPHGRPSAISESIMAALRVFDHHMKRFREYTVTSKYPELAAAALEKPEAARLAEGLEALKVIHYVAEQIQPLEKRRYFPVDLSEKHP